MSRLIPEKRLDKNGRLVTKHVRDGGTTPTAGRLLPPPSLEAPATGAPLLHAKKPKPLPRQLEQRRFALPPPGWAAASRKLWVEGIRELNWRLDITHRRALEFEASDVEAYGVFEAVSRPVDALHLLAAGIRGAEPAREFARSRGAEELLQDRSALCAAALGRRIPFEEFFKRYGAFERPDRDPADIAAAIAFSLTPLSDAHQPREGTTAEAIADGTVSFDDIKAIGAGRFSDWQRLRSMGTILRAMRAGQCDWTPKGVSEVLERPRKEGLHYWSDYDKLAAFMTHAPMDDVLAAPSIQGLAEAYSTLTLGTKGVHPEPADAAALALYASSLGVLGRWGNVSTPWGEIVRFRDAGVPAAVARDVLAAGGTSEQAKAVHAGDVEAGLSSGYL